MSKGPHLFRQTDLTRALRAAQRAGVPVRVEIEPNKLVVIPVEKPKPPAVHNPEYDL